MFGPFERAVAGRYLRARRGERFVSIIAIFSLVGIALGVATLIVVTSVMSGFQQELVARALGISGHLTVESYAGESITDYEPLVAKVRAIPGVVSVLPVIDGQVAISTESGGLRGALVRGVTQDGLRGLHDISDHVIAGSLDNFGGDDAIAVGAGIATLYRLHVGSQLTLISSQSTATPFGSIPRTRPYTVVAVFNAGLAEYNDQVVFMPLPMAQIFFQKPNAVSGVQIWIADPADADRIVAPLKEVFAGHNVILRDWRHQSDQLVNILQVQKDTMFIVLGMIILVAAFNVISSLIMLVKDKTADIAVMRTMGARAGAVMRIFLMCGAFVGVTGTAVGTALGLVICRNIVAIQRAIEDFTGGQVFDSRVFQLTQLPSTVDWGDVVRVVLLGLALAVLATLYPSWRAARTDPVEALRNG
ncbi:MAG: lipoprotein-releasing ABC transporter permease subunit [Methylobacteriaceae bacterium]|nr:lipoprotein-releasing ABC transporter permease subunit [Methylobacteriaceae bacterium]MBV9813414.1 lipoprotein-releasing ABC transporter permease subunit [Acetobacteraceae bacterium]